MVSGSYEAGGGQPALLVAVAHLNELLSAVESANSRAMFLVGINVASNSLFVAVLASLRQPWEAAVFPIVIAIVAVGCGLWMLGQRRQPQFPVPADLLRAAGRGVSDDRLAWMVVETIDEARLALNGELRRVSRWVTALQVLTTGHLAGLAVTGLGLIL